MKNKTKSKSSKQRDPKPGKPVTIAIHGPGVDIDAKFATTEDADHSPISDSLLLLVDRVSRRMGGAGNSASVPPEQELDQLARLVNQINSLATSVTPEQVEAWRNAATDAQQLMISEIIGTARGFAQPEQPRDIGTFETFETVQRVIENCDSDALRAIIDLASARLEDHATAAPRAQPGGVVQ